MPMAANRPPKASACWATTPPISTCALGGIVPSARRASLTPWTATDVAPVSPLVISAVIVAEGDSSIRVIRLWTSACSTVAMAASGTLTVMPTGSAFSASTEVRLAASSRNTRSTGSAPPSWIRPTVVGVSAVRISAPTWAVVNPTPMALFGSTRTWTSGAAVTRSLVTFLSPAWVASADSTACAVWATTASSSALTTTLRALLDPPPCTPAVTLKPSVATGDRLVASASIFDLRSADSSTRTIIVAPPVSPPNWAARIVWKPTSLSPGRVVATSLTSGSAMTIASACFARSRTCFEVAPLGGTTATWAIFSDPELMNAVGSLDTSAREATNSTAAARTVPTFVRRLLSTQRIAGSYSRTQRECLGSPASSTSWLTLSTRKKARTGTTVSATTSDASSANVTVSENERKNWLTKPPAKPRGRNTATVVRVLAVIA